MKEIKIFLASSGNLQDERDEIEKLISRLNDDWIKKDTYLKLIIWEKLSAKFSTQRKQEDFNDEVRKSDVFICLIHDKIGPFSKEEYDAAYDGFITNSKPELVYIYFSDKEIKPSQITENFKNVLDLKMEISKNHQFYRTYNSVDGLLYSITRDFETDLETLSIFSPKLKMLEILEKSNQGISDYLETNNSASLLLTGLEYDKLEEIKPSLLKLNIATFESNGNMIANRPDGHIRAGWVLTKLSNY